MMVGRETISKMCIHSSFGKGGTWHSRPDEMLRRTYAGRERNSIPRSVGSFKSHFRRELMMWRGTKGLKPGTQQPFTVESHFT